jgi:hypothetical protein
VLENHRQSFFAFLLDRDYIDADVEFAWMHPATRQAPAELQQQLEHARCFSEIMHGAAILYNLFLGELEPHRDEVIKDCIARLQEWIELITNRHDVLTNWDRQEFWTLLARNNNAPSIATRAFVEEWCGLVLDRGPGQLRDTVNAKTLIFNREIQIKGALARCENRRSGEMWRGDAGLGRLDFRWSNARLILRDVAAGLAGDHA